MFYLPFIVDQKLHFSSLANPYRFLYFLCFPHSLSSFYVVKLQYSHFTRQLSNCEFSAKTLVSSLSQMDQKLNSRQANVFYKVFPNNEKTSLMSRFVLSCVGYSVVFPSTQWTVCCYRPSSKIKTRMKNRQKDKLKREFFSLIIQPVFSQEKGFSMSTIYIYFSTYSFFVMSFKPENSRFFLVGKEQ